MQPIDDRIFALRVKEHIFPYCFTENIHFFFLSFKIIEVASVANTECPITYVFIYVDLAFIIIAQRDSMHRKPKFKFTVHFPMTFWRTFGDNNICNAVNLIDFRLPNDQFLDLFLTHVHAHVFSGINYINVNAQLALWFDLTNNHMTFNVIRDLHELKMKNEKFRNRK